jgi:hypothetical protein
MHPMVLLGDEAQVEGWFGPFRDSANHDKIGAWFVPNVPQARKSCWTQSMELLSDVGHVESRFSSFGDCVSVSVSAR